MKLPGFGMHKLAHEWECFRTVKTRIKEPKAFQET